MLTFNLLSIFLADQVSVRVKNPFVCAPSIGEKTLDAKWDSTDSLCLARERDGFNPTQST
jgi:hypothetical protein